MDKTLKVLLVDDSPLIINRLTRMLGDMQNIERITTAGTLLEARFIMNRQETNVMVLDINLPDGNGIQFLKWVQSHHPAVKVIMFSNMAGEFHRKAALAGGATHFLDKSSEFFQLLAILDDTKSC